MIKPLLLPFVIVVVLRLVWFVFDPSWGSGAVSAKGAKIRLSFRLAGLFILFGGLLASVRAYERAKLAPPETGHILSYEVGPGYAVPVPGDYSKKSYDEMLRVGGKANVFASEVLEWISARRHPRELPATLAVLSLGGFCVCFFLARFLTMPDDQRNA